MNPSGTQTLIDALTDGNHLRLVDHEISGLLGWMAGSSSSREARELRQAFGEAGRDERVTERGFRLLDHALFDRQTLLESVAGVGEDRSNEERRRRYRLLLSAFHPDRYPDRAVWLTERSQIITIAYSRFKSGKPPIRPVPVVKASPLVARKRPRRFVRPPTKWLSRLARMLRQRFGGDPWLAQKIIGLFALVLVLPLLSVFLDYEDRGARFKEQGSRGDEEKGLRGESELVDRIPGAEATADRALAGAVTGTGVNQAERSEAAVPAEPAAPQLDRRALAQDGGSDRQPSGPGGQAAAENQNATALAVHRSPAQSSDQPDRPSSGQVSRDTRSSDPGAQVAAVDRRQDPSTAILAGSSEPTAARPAATARANAESSPVSTPTTFSADVAVSHDASEVEQAAIVRAEEGQDVAGEIDPPPPTARGRLLLGPLGSHEIGALLQRYQLALEQADIETLSRLIGREQAEELRARFPELFDSGEQHRVDLSILQSQRDGDQWVVQLQQEVGVSAIDRRARSFSHRAEFRFSPDPFVIQMIEMEF